MLEPSIALRAHPCLCRGQFWSAIHYLPASLRVLRRVSYLGASLPDVCVNTTSRRTIISEASLIRSFSVTRRLSRSAAPLCGCSATLSPLNCSAILSPAERVEGGLEPRAIATNQSSREHGGRADQRSSDKAAGTLYVSIRVGTLSRYRGTSDEKKLDSVKTALEQTGKISVFIGI